MPTEIHALRTRATSRYAIGITLAIAVSQGVAWSLSYIAPVFVALLLSSTHRPLSFREGFRVLVLIAAAMLVGVMVGSLLLPYPVVCVLVITLLLFAIFYAAAGGTPPFTVTFLLIAVTILPVVGQQQSATMMQEVATALILAGAVAIALHWVAFALVPTLPAAGTAGAERSIRQPPPGERVLSAMRATAVILPLELAFLVLGWSPLLVLVFAALLAAQPTLRAGIQGARSMVAANLLGGAAAVLAYGVLVAVPSFPMLIALSLLLALAFGSRAFSESKFAPLYRSAFSTTLVLIGSSVSPLGDEADEEFYKRLAQVMLAGVYIAAAFYVSGAMRVRSWRRRPVATVA